ncbi:MAG TPA: putative quinol monooxygenase [Acidisoma sp.]|jgi:quinol monooxygenase YgiN|uniref:putative quinol monooxygenase n=1 Tax=Acidisoma sp. TaxID=1872115 RepID=UPI002BB07E41|nr:putative quinol monooxygenase [Acidisoma sp.]HTI00188.1 putative quinol monooxygenase [Acidisoma sp.]
MIHVIAVLTAKIGHRASLLAALQAIVEDVRQEPGCLEYQPVIDLSTSPVKFGADTLVVIEKWQDQAALDAHNAAPALTGFMDRAKHLIAQADVYLMRDA